MAKQPRGKSYTYDQILKNIERFFYLEGNTGDRYNEWNNLLDELFPDGRPANKSQRRSLAMVDKAKADAPVQQRRLADRNRRRLADRNRRGLADGRGSGLAGATRPSQNTKEIKEMLKERLKETAPKKSTYSKWATSAAKSFNEKPTKTSKSTNNKITQVMNNPKSAGLESDKSSYSWNEINSYVKNAYKYTVGGDASPEREGGFYAGYTYPQWVALRDEMFPNGKPADVTKQYDIPGTKTTETSTTTTSSGSGLGANWGYIAGSSTKTQKKVKAAYKALKAIEEFSMKQSIDESGWSTSGKLYTGSLTIGGKTFSDWDYPGKSAAGNQYDVTEDLKRDAIAYVYSDIAPEGFDAGYGWASNPDKAGYKTFSDNSAIGVKYLYDEKHTGYVNKDLQIEMATGYGGGGSTTITNESTVIHTNNEVSDETFLDIWNRLSSIPASQGGIELPKVKDRKALTDQDRIDLKAIDSEHFTDDRLNLIDKNGLNWEDTLVLSQQQEIPEVTDDELTKLAELDPEYFNNTKINEIKANGRLSVADYNKVMEANPNFKFDATKILERLDQLEVKTPFAFDITDKAQLYNWGFSTEEIADIESRGKFTKEEQDHITKNAGVTKAELDAKFDNVPTAEEIQKNTLEVIKGFDTKDFSQTQIDNLVTNLVNMGGMTGKEEYDQTILGIQNTIGENKAAWLDKITTLSSNWEKDLGLAVTHFDERIKAQGTDIMSLQDAVLGVLNQQGKLTAVFETIVMEQGGYTRDLDSPSGWRRMTEREMYAGMNAQDRREYDVNKHTIEKALVYQGFNPFTHESIAGDYKAMEEWLTPTEINEIKLEEVAQEQSFWDAGFDKNGKKFESEQAKLDAGTEIQRQKYLAEKRSAELMNLAMGIVIDEDTGIQREASASEMAELIDPLTKRQIKKAEETLKTQLAQRGIEVGSTGYNDAIAQFENVREQMNATAVQRTLGFTEKIGAGLSNQRLAEKEFSTKTASTFSGDILGEKKFGINAYTGLGQYGLAKNKQITSGIGSSIDYWAKAGQGYLGAMKPELTQAGWDVDLEMAKITDARQRRIAADNKAASDFAGLLQVGTTILTGGIPFLDTKSDTK